MSRWKSGAGLKILFGLAIAGVSLGADSSTGRSRRLSRSEATLHERVGKLDEFAQELERLLNKVRRGQLVLLKEVRDVEVRYEVSVLDAVDMELSDVYRLEQLLRDLAEGMPQMGKPGEGMENAVPMTSRKEEEGEVPSPEPPSDSLSDLTPAISPIIKTDWNKMGDSYFSLGEYQNALRAYQKVDREKHTARLLYQIALCYEHLDQFPSAQRSYESVVDKYPETYWGKQSVWALEYVSWKQELGKFDAADQGQSKNEEEKE